MFTTIHEAASLHMHRNMSCAKIKFYEINVYDFHCHQKFSSLHTFLVVRYDSTAEVHVSTLLNKQAL